MSVPKWKPGPYTFQHVDSFSMLTGLEEGTIEITDENRTDNWLAQALTVEQAQLFAAAPDLYAALEAFTDGTTRDWTNRMINARKALAKANPTRPTGGQ